MRRFTLGAFALLAATASPALAAPGKSGAAHATGAKDNGLKAAPNFDAIMGIVDKLFPAQPDPDPARLALARTAMNGYLPAGSYGHLVDTMVDSAMNDIYGRVMGMTGTELSNAIGLPLGSGPDAALTFRERASKDDPLFDARAKAYAAAFKTQMRETMVIMEPRMRDGMARAMARKFSVAQLEDLNRFFATDTGRAFGQNAMLMWVDGDVWRGMFAAMPELMRAMPVQAKRFEAIEKQYPWPKKAEKAPVAKSRPKAKK